MSRRSSPASTLQDRPFTEVTAAVRAHLARGETKEAVERAREAHERVGSRASEELLVEAYLARIANLEARGLAVEARNLAHSVTRRFPASRARLAAEAGARSLEEQVRPLGDPALGAEDRARLEDAVRREVTDLAALTGVTSLPDDHPLRRAAGALDAALTAVTSGPVGDEALLLPEVSRKSPLAPWKLLLRAIACYQRRDDARCEEALAAIPADAAAARAVPALRGLLRGQRPPGFPAPPASLDAELARLDAAFAGGRSKAIVRAIEGAVAACAQEAPDLLVSLRQRVSVRAMLAGVPVERVRRALGAAPRRDATYWQLFALGQERQDHLVPAASAWVEAQRVATLEGRLPPAGPEAAAPFLRAAELLGRARAANDSFALEAFRAEFDGYASYYEGQPPEVARWAPQGRPDLDALDEERLLERACSLDPVTETFERRLTLARGDQEHTKAADLVAAAWAAALPGDVAPRLYLMASAEERGALAQALGHLEAAEQVDRLSPAVRRARFRLLVATVRRHAKQKKPHLVRKDLAAMDALADAREGARPALVAALRVVEARLTAPADEVTRREAEVERLLARGPLAASVLTCLALEACGLGRPVPGGELAPGIVSALGCVALLAEEVGWELDVPHRFAKAIRGDLDRDAPGATAEELRALTAAVLARKDRELAYALSAAGLRRGGPTTARFLLLRARSLPEFSRARRRAACAAAAELARRVRDTDLAKEAAELSRGPASWDVAADAAPVDVERTLERERAERALPTRPTEEDYLALDRERASGPCGCPACRAGASPFDEDEDDDEALFGVEDFVDGALADMSPTLQAAMRDMLKLAERLGRMPRPGELAELDPALAIRLLAALEADERAQRGKGRRR